MRSQVTKPDPAGESSFEKFKSRLQRLESLQDHPSEKIEKIEKRLAKIEKCLSDSSFHKHYEETQAKISDCLKDLKENLKYKEKEFCEKFENQLKLLKEDIKLSYSKEVKKVKEKQEVDEIDSIIQELQERIKKKSPTQKRSESFSGLRNRSGSPKSSDRKLKGKISARKLKKKN